MRGVSAEKIGCKGREKVSSNSEKNGIKLKNNSK